MLCSLLLGGGGRFLSITDRGLGRPSCTGRKRCKLLQRISVKVPFWPAISAESLQVLSAESLQMLLLRFILLVDFSL